MKITLFYEENKKRLILKRETNEWINIQELKRNGIHCTKINGNYELVIYLDAITQKRLDNIHNYLLQHNYQIQFNDDFFKSLNRFNQGDNMDNVIQSEQLFLQATYDVLNEHFINYQDSVMFSSLKDVDIAAEYSKKIRMDISNTLSNIISPTINSVIDSTLDFSVCYFVRELIDTECERYRASSYKYKTPIAILYNSYMDEFFAPLDWMVRQSYIKVAIKKKYNITNCAPSAMPIRTILEFIYQEISNGWNKNTAIVALSQLLYMIKCDPIDMPMIYSHIINESYKASSEAEVAWYMKLKASSLNEKAQAQYFFDPILIKHMY